MRRPGKHTFPVLQRHVSRIELVDDDELKAAMAWALRELRLVLEPSGAASLAVVLREGSGRCGVILSGGNVDGAAGLDRSQFTPIGVVDRRRGGIRAEYRFWLGKVPPFTQLPYALGQDVLAADEHRGDLAVFRLVTVAATNCCYRRRSY